MDTLWIERRSLSCLPIRRSCCSLKIPQVLIFCTAEHRIAFISTVGKLLRGTQLACRMTDGDRFALLKRMKTAHFVIARKQYDPTERFRRIFFSFLARRFLRWSAAGRDIINLKSADQNTNTLTMFSRAASRLASTTRSRVASSTARGLSVRTSKRNLVCCL
jgi:hypothetical protein